MGDDYVGRQRMMDDSWAVVSMMDTIRCRFEDRFFDLLLVVFCLFVVFVIWILVIAERERERGC